MSHLAFPVSCGARLDNHECPALAGTALMPTRVPCSSHDSPSSQRLHVVTRAAELAGPSWQPPCYPGHLRLAKKERPGLPRGGGGRLPSYLSDSLEEPERG